jgi:hypothetical protein
MPTHCEHYEDEDGRRKQQSLYYDHREMSHHSDHAPMNANTRNTTGSGPLLSPMFARAMGVPDSTDTGFTPLSEFFVETVMVLRICPAISSSYVWTTIYD